MEAEPVKKEKTKRVMSDKQLENLRKGMEVLKQKREAISKEKEEKAEKKRIENPPPQSLPVVKAVPAVVEPIAPIDLTKKVSKPRGGVAKRGIDKDDFDSLRKDILTKPDYEELKNSSVSKSDYNELKNMITTKMTPIEKEIVVHKERLLSGSELLNKIFFS
jgi:hypothetical protein